MRVRFFLAAPMAAMILVAGCSGPGAAPAASAPGASAPAASPRTDIAGSQAQAQAINVELGDWFFEPATWNVRTGSVTFNMRNSSPERRHTMSVRNLSGGGVLAESEELEAGQSGTFTFNVTAPGSYEVFCRIRGHEDRGQKGTLVVQ